jgi:FtsP/CotA-like multicopper oxidase with cupredoxin domain
MTIEGSEVTMPSTVQATLVDNDTEPSQDVLVQVAGPLSRRRFLHGAAVVGGGVVAATVAACAPAPPPGWLYKSPTPGPTGVTPSLSPLPSLTAAPTAPPSSAPTATPGGPVPAGWTEMDIHARNKIRRYLGNLVPALQGIYGDQIYAKLGTILGAADNYPELGQKPAFMQVGPQLVLNDLLSPLTPTIEAGVKVFRLTIDHTTIKVDELSNPINGLGFNGQIPGPTIRVNEGDRVRVLFTNNMDETTGIHFHGQEFDDFFMDGIPFITELPIVPGETRAYEFNTRNTGSLMYHSHHNATDQVGRGLLGAFIVEPAANPVTYDREYIWVSNDVLGGFTINGHGFPATVPVLAAVGEKVLVRFMNEGVMMHPFHSHGFAMDIVARDGWDLGTSRFRADTIGVNPGERWDAVITADRPGIWAFHCHILPHVEGPMGMFGMVTALVVVPEKAHVDAIVGALTA